MNEVNFKHKIVTIFCPEVIFHKSFITPSDYANIIHTYETIFYKFSPNRELKFEKPGQEMIQHCQMLQNILTF